MSQWTARNVKRKTRGYVVPKTQMHSVPNYLNQVNYILYGKSKSQPIYLYQNIYYSMYTRNFSSFFNTMYISFRSLVLQFDFLDLQRIFLNVLEAMVIATFLAFLKLMLVLML